MSAGGTPSTVAAASVPAGAARWWVLALLSLAIAGSYYEYDAIAPIADFLRSERGFTQAQIGMLNAVFSLPNIFLALLGGVLIDRYGPARIATWTAALCLAGAALTALGSPYAVMVTGRLIFGVAEEALFIALLAGLAQWFAGGATALAMALFFSFARVGSYAADTSPGWAHAFYAHGWRLTLGRGVQPLTGPKLTPCIVRHGGCCRRPVTNYARGACVARHASARTTGVSC